MEATDEQLMLAYRGGDAQAFEALYARHRGALYRYVLRGVRDRARAEELYQEIWLRVVEARGRYEPRARFSTWLYTIAHHRLIDHWRHHELQTVSADSGDGVAPDPPGPAALQPERLAQLKEELERLAQAIARLPFVQREAFLLREEGDLSVAEIAAVTGAGDEAVKSRLRYAYAKLRAALDDG